jgi:hypothetical protein
MRVTSLGILILVLGVCAATAETPDPPCADVMPWDVYGKAFVTPGASSEGGVGEIVVTVRNMDCEPIEGSFVEVDFSDCPNVCINPEDDGLTGVSGEQGVVVLNPQVGGCDECTVIVRASGVTIATYQSMASTDWNGQEADGVVGVADFAFFSTAFKVTGHECADFNGDEVVNGLDFSIFSTSFKRGDANLGGCQ